VRVDLAAAEQFLRDRYGGEIGVVTPIARQGVWSSAYRFDRRGADFVIRFTPYVADLEKDRRAARFASAELPIPPVLEMGSAFDGYFAISPYIEGAHIDGLDEPGMRQVLPSLLATLDAMRRVDLSAFSGYGDWNSDGLGHFPGWRAMLLDVRSDRGGRGMPPWRQRLADSPTGAQAFDRAFDVFSSLAERCPEERHLVHADLLHFNVLVAHDRVAAILDWGCSVYGDFLYDLAWLAFWRPWFPAWSGIDFAREGLDFYRSRGVPLPGSDERLRCYQLHIGLGHQQWYASRGDWANLEKTARHTLAIAESE